MGYSSSSYFVLIFVIYSIGLTMVTDGDQGGEVEGVHLPQKLTFPP